MVNQVLFSIAIPTYNRLELLKKALDSALNQTYTNIEVIVLDNNSTDGTKEWLDEQDTKQKLKIIYQSTNLGSVGNIKTIPKYISGKYLVVLSDDDWLDQNFVKEAVDDLENNPEAAIWYSRTYISNEGNKKLNRMTKIGARIENGVEFVTQSLRQKREAFFVATVYRVEILQQVDAFQGNSISIDYSARLLCALNHQVISNPKVLAVYNRRKNSTSGGASINDWRLASKEIYHLLNGKINNQSYQFALIYSLIRDTENSCVLSNGLKNIKHLITIREMVANDVFYFLILFMRLPFFVVRIILPNRVINLIKFSILKFRNRTFYQ
jgi:glycosyltransferase involved in cell wall biosynthesis